MHGSHQVLDDGEPQPGAAHFAGTARVHPIEPLEDPQAMPRLDAGAVITTERHSPTESGVLAKSASGALEMIPYVQITNLADALEELKALGFQTIGLDSEGPEPLEGTFSGKKVALVLGAEGPGMRHNIREHTDALAKLPITDQVESLNVSNAAAVALYAASVA